MHCVALPIRGIGVLDVCVHGGRIREVRLRVGIDGVHGEAYEGLAELILRYINGALEPREIVKHLELSPGLLGLAQIAMLAIPRGRVATYSQIARLLNTSPRAVGKLASANKLPVIVPCHRVIRSDGSLGGYSISDSSDSAEVKMALLRMEGVQVINGKVPKHYIVDNNTLMNNFRELLRLMSQDRAID